VRTGVLFVINGYQSNFLTGYLDFSKQKDIGRQTYGTKAGKWTDAINEYKKVIEISPNDADSNFNLAIIYETQRNDRKMAIYHYQKYLGANPEAPDANTVKEHITEMNLGNKVWGEPYPFQGNIKENRGRLW